MNFPRFMMYSTNETRRITMRKKFTEDFKFKVALEAIKNEKTATEIASDYEISVSQVSSWKNELLSNGKQVFAKKRGPKKADPLKEPDYLLREIGELKVERDYLAKKFVQLQSLKDD